MDKSLVNVQPKGKLRNDKNQNNVKTGTGMSDFKENSLDVSHTFVMLFNAILHGNGRKMFRFKQT